MRKRGFSYSEIQNKMNLPKSTIAYWLRGVKLTKEQEKNLRNRRSEIAKANIEKRVSKTAKLIEEIKSSSAQTIDKISKRELWLMGIVLYWKSRNKSDVKNGARFTSSDPSLIKLFLKWLYEIGEIKTDEIIPDIFIEKSNEAAVDDAKKYWAKITKLPKSHFRHVYFHKRKKPQVGKKYRRNGYGLLRIRIKSSSMLARQIHGWISGIEAKLP